MLSDAEGCCLYRQLSGHTMMVDDSSAIPRGEEKKLTDAWRLVLKEVEVAKYDAKGAQLQDKELSTRGCCRDIGEMTI